MLKKKYSTLVKDVRLTLFRAVATGTGTPTVAFHSPGKRSAGLQHGQQASGNL